ncbi:MAG: hypothetical protein K2M69_08735 [Muribaculaceae bacterium]|nr:hypothetical protein [Muribaculaceae bacterium]
MKKIFKLSALLPVMALAAGCSDKDLQNERLEGDFDVIMSIRTDGTRADGETDPFDALDANRLYFATYDISGNGNQKDWLYEGGTLNNTLSTVYFTPWWGPSISAKFEKEAYKNGFFTGVFSVPSYANADFKIQGKNFADMTNLTLKWPQSVMPGGSLPAWTPASEKDFPMAGIAKVDADFMAGYLEHIHYNSPLNLPTTEMVRAMAKIVIVDEVEGGIIGKVELESLLTGYLTPQPASWFNGTALPYSPSANDNTFTQWLDASNSTVDGRPAYEFYCFERDFTGVKAGDDARKVIKLTAKADYTLPADKREIKLSFAPYGEDKSVANPTDAPSGDWAGILRNHVYTFRIHQPPVGGIQIQVTSASWKDHDKEAFNF